MNIYRFITGITILLLLSSCATMDKSECRSADWELIGMEDGARGRLVTYLSNHRKACAEYGVKPNLAQYQSGHKSGVRQFCTADNGFQLGRKGRGYNDVCPAELRRRFVAAYETGHELYQLSSEINHLLGEVHSYNEQLQERELQIQRVESRLISTSLSTGERKALLDQFKQLQTDIATLKIEIRDAELAAARMQGEYDVLNSQHGY